MKRTELIQELRTYIQRAIRTGQGLSGRETIKVLKMVIRYIGE